MFPILDIAHVRTALNTAVESTVLCAVVHGFQAGGAKTINPNDRFIPDNARPSSAKAFGRN